MPPRLSMLVVFALVACGDAAGNHGDQILQTSSTVATSADDAGTTPAPLFSAGCSLAVHFGSYAAGIDLPTYRTVQALLQKDAGVLGIQDRRWGPEGEVSLCARTRTPRDAARLFERVKRLIPADPRGPIEIETGDGRKYQVSRYAK